VQSVIAFVGFLLDDDADTSVELSSKTIDGRLWDAFICLIDEERSEV
jgi:hypothetical protein